MPIDLMLPTPTPDEIKASRAATGLSGEDAAALIGLSSRRDWWRYESGHTVMDPRSWALWLLATDQHPGYRAMPTRRRAQQNEALQSLADDSQTYGAKGF